MKTSKPKVDLIVAARPNFVKAAPVFQALQAAGLYDLNLIHTGQHHDDEMSASFFKHLNIPDPDFNLHISGGTHAEQTARTMLAFEKYLSKRKPSWIFVFGDVNATIACSMVAKKLSVKIAHVEAGLRSFDMSMPEEINRVLTDSISDIYFTTCLDASENLIKEGKERSKIHLVGNTMIDSLVHFAKQIPELANTSLKNRGLKKNEYLLLTLHRPFNVDDSITLKSLIDSLLRISKNRKIVFPVHPRTARILEKNSSFLKQTESQLILSKPLPYLEFLSTMQNAHSVFTDSGGVQEETSFLGIACYTLRPNTERPITVSMGTNRLVKPEDLSSLNLSKSNFGKECKIPLWDGKASYRISQEFAKLL